MPSDFALKSMNAVHRTMLLLSGGLIGWHAAGMPVLQLTTVGRRSGEPRTVLLTSPVQIGPSLVIVASRGGDDRNPAWFLNLRDRPEVKVARNGRAPQPMRARIASGHERDELWAEIVAKAKNYAGYQSRTDREIPVVVLDPVS